MARAVAWVVYPDRVEKVEIVKKGANERHLIRPVKNPITVEDENGNRYIVPVDQLYNDPISASVRQAEYAQQFNLRANPLEDEDDEGDEEEEDDEEEEEDEGDDEEEDEEEDDEEEE